MRRKVDLLVNINAYAQEWVWRFSKATGLVKYVFLAIVRFIPRGQFQTEPTPIEELIEATGLSDSTIRRATRELEDAGELEVLRQGRRGTIHRYKLMRELQLPLDIEPGARGAASSVRQTGDGGPRHRSDRSLSSVPQTGGQRSERLVAPFTETGVIGQGDRSDRSVGTVSPVAETDAPVRTCTSEVVRTEEDHDDHHHDALVELHAWWVVEFRQQRGKPTAVTVDEFLVTARQVRAAGYSVDDIKAMARLMWATVDLAVHSWIPTTDYSIKVLYRALDWLGPRIEQAAAKTDSRGHTPPCRTWTECNARYFREAQGNQADEAVG